MTRALALLGMMLALLGAPLLASAQQATPAPSLSAALSGQPVKVIGPEGGEVAQIALTQLADPFEDYVANSPPEHGFRFVLAQVSVQNTGARPFQVDPNAFALLDADGYLNGHVGISRGEDVTVPDLEYQEIAPGDTISGAVAFQVLAGATLDALLFLPSSDQAVTVAALHPTPAPAPGQPASIAGPSGKEIEQVTVSDLTDPFQDYDPNSAPERGNHFVALTLTVKNTSPRPMAVDPSAVFLLDSEGFLYRSGNVYRANEASPPDLQYQDALAPGAETSGFVGFQVLNGSHPVAVVYRPGNDRFITLAEVESGQ
jgi:hypothetical protein